ncbi:MAG: hypothetical protein ABI600_18960 [Luteolibacter sp.]
MIETPGFKRQIFKTVLLALASLAVGAAFISRQSFWMDEGGPAFKSLMPTLKDWWFMSMRLGGSDPQMPVYMFLLWIWEKFGATSEYAMRAVNLPWLVLTVLALKRVRFWPLVCLTSPFVLYYVGELRPYAMQIAAGAMAAAALIKVGSRSDENGFNGLHLTAGASLLLSCSSLTGAVWALGLWVGVLILKPKWICQGGFWSQIIPWALGALVIGAYYGFTLLQGFRAAGMQSSSILSVFFGFYEMIGLLGWGPGKNELRDSLKSTVPFLPLLVPAFICIFGAWLAGILGWVKQSSTRTIIGVTCAVLLPVIILSAIGLAMNFRVLGRHLSPAIPAVLLPIALSLAGSGRWKTPGRVVSVLAICMSLVSAITLRISERHARDDFHTASTLALDALERHKSVWWQADMNCMRYYAYLKGGMPLVLAVQHLESDPPANLLMADYVIINRPDLRYRGADYQKELLQNSYKQTHRFTGFEVWTTGF